VISLRWSTLPTKRTLGAIRPALAVAVLAAFVAGTVLSGHKVAGLRASADAASIAAGPTSAQPARANLPDVVGALQVFGGRSNTAAADARASRSLLRLPLHQWIRPYGGYFSSPFGYRWGRLHAGIDLAGPWGTSIYAATDGCIEYAGPMAGYGEVMKIRDWDGTETVYGHMSSFVVRSGCVHAGDAVARIGSGGDATGPHLHFEVRIGGTPVDPVPFLAKRGVYI
jgi:murein DD-endopeptidase MepM/ murein hydrolase activator NlpD